jgi:hypothetical protein
MVMFMVAHDVEHLVILGTLELKKVPAGFTWLSRIRSGAMKCLADTAGFGDVSSQN